MSAGSNQEQRTQEGKVLFLLKAWEEN